MLCFALFFVNGCSGAGGSYEGETYTYKYETEQIVSPFWKSDVMYNETVMMVKDGDGAPCGRLLFNAKKIISVRDSTLEKEYVEGKDYTYKDGVITLLEGAKLPYLTKEQLLGKNLPSNITPMPTSKTETQKLLFTETPYIFERQLAVTYVYNKEDWTMTMPGLAEDKLPKTIEKLKKGDALKVLVYGDSIAAGCNSSRVLNVEPYTPTWAELIKLGLEQKYDSTVTVINSSVAGMTSQWGAENAQSIAAPHKPDLAIISIGMNDGTGNINPQTVGQNIQAIMDAIRQANPDVEFILIVTMLANPQSDYLGNQREQAPVLMAKQGEGVAVIDMGAFHEELLKRKSYIDMTGNNINHPNDFLARCFAMSILSLLAEY